MSVIRFTMSAIVDENTQPIDPEAEVRKLQDLVKKLEHQNQILRKKQNQQQKDQDGNVLNANSMDTNHVNKTSRNSNNTHNKNIHDNDANVTLDDFDLLDVDNLTLDNDEENWLYESPKKVSPADRSIDPCRWVREEFEHPSPEIDSIKRSLLFKLEECSSRVSRSSSAGTLGSIVSPGSGDEAPAHHNHYASSPNLKNGPLSLSRRLNYDDHSQSPMPSIKSPATGLDTGTFTRPKRQSRLGLGTGTIRLGKQQADNLDRPVIKSKDEEAEDDQTDGHAQFRVGSPDLDEECEPSPLDSSLSQSQQKLDVRALAKLQEESLRQSFTAGSSPRKGSKSRSGIGLGIADSSSSPDNSNRSSPGRFDGEAYHTTSRSNNSLASPSSQSSLGSPPDSPHGSNQHLDKKPHHLSETRRSLPNLSRMAYPQGLQTFSRNRETHNRDNSLGRARETSLGRTRDTSVGRTRDTSLGRTRDSSLGRTRDSSLGRNVTRQPGSGARQASPARAMSPSRPGIPVARSSIPRPGSASRLPTPKKSGIPTAPRMSLTPRTEDDDDSWKEGCF